MTQGSAAGDSAHGHLPILSATVRIRQGPQIALLAAGSGPVVVLLHGIGGAGIQWQAQIEALCADHCVIAWDARGYGGSSGPPVERFADFAHDLFAVLDALGVERALAVGHSMGGRILLEAARIDQSRFAALVLSGTQSAYLEHMSEADRADYVAKREGLFSDGTPTRQAAERVARTVLAPGTAQEVVDQMVARFMELRREGYLAALAASVGWNAQEVLARLTMPVRVIGGALDPVCPAEETRRIAAAIAGPPAVILDGVAHMPNLEAPQDFNAALAPFLAEHAGAASRADAAALLRGARP